MYFSEEEYMKYTRKDLVCIIKNQFDLIEKLAKLSSIPDFEIQKEERVAVLYYAEVKNGLRVVDRKICVSNKEIKNFYEQYPKEYTLYKAKIHYNPRTFLLSSVVSPDVFDLMIGYKRLSELEYETIDSRPFSRRLTRF